MAQDQSRYTSDVLSCGTGCQDTSPPHACERIRPMTKMDIGPVVSLIGQSMNESEGYQALQTFQFHFDCRSCGINDGRNYYVFVEDNSIAGVVGLHHEIWGPPESVWLAWFAVRPDMRSRGVGRTLLDFVMEKARIQGYMKILIETYSTPEFSAARAFYRARGFAVAGGVKNYLPGGGNMVVFAKEISHAR